MSRPLLFALLLSCLTACAPEQAAGPAQLGELRGQWVLVNYWARWCKPCIEEIPELNAIDRKRPDVTVLGVNYDGATGEELARQVRELGLDFTVLEADPAAELGVPRPVVLPTTLLVDPRGRMVQSLVGPQTLQSLEKALDAAAAAPGKG